MVKGPGKLRFGSFFKVYKRGFFLLSWLIIQDD